MPSFGHWVYTADRDATIEAYSQIERGGADRCDCAWCRNFRKVRPQVFPSEFLALLGVLGIDPNKDAEVYHIARLAPGRHYYGGWYHFVGNFRRNGRFSPYSLRHGVHDVDVASGSAKTAESQGITRRGIGIQL